MESVKDRFLRNISLGLLIIQTMKTYGGTQAYQAIRLLSVYRYLYDLLTSLVDSGLLQNDTIVQVEAENIKLKAKKGDVIKLNKRLQEVIFSVQLGHQMAVSLSRLW